MGGRVGSKLARLDLRLTVAERAEYSELARRHGITMSELVRRGVRSLVDKQQQAAKRGLLTVADAWVYAGEHMRFRAAPDGFLDVQRYSDGRAAWVEYTRANDGYIALVQEMAEAAKTVGAVANYGEDDAEQ